MMASFHDGMLIGTLCGALIGFATGKVVSGVREALRRYRTERELAEKRRSALAEARSALAAITRYPHDMEHVQRIATEGIRDSAVE